MKTFADNKLNVAIMVTVNSREKNLIGNGEIAPLYIVLLAHLSTECSVSYCDQLPSVGVRLSDVHPQVSC